MAEEKNAKKVVKEAKKQLILSVIKQSENGTALATEIVAKTGISLKYTKLLLSELEAEGKVKITKKGRIMIVSLP